MRTVEWFRATAGCEDPGQRRRQAGSGSCEKERNEEGAEKRREERSARGGEERRNDSRHFRRAEVSADWARGGFWTRDVDRGESAKDGRVLRGRRFWWSVEDSQ